MNSYLLDRDHFDNHSVVCKSVHPQWNQMDMDHIELLPPNHGIGHLCNSFIKSFFTCLTRFEANDELTWSMDCRRS